MRNPSAHSWINSYRCLLAFGLATGLITTTALNASTLQEPGYTETVIGTIPAATNGYGGMTTDGAGNLYFAANEADQVFSGPSAGPLAQFGTVAGNQGMAVVVIGNTLYSSFNSPGEVYSQDLAEVAPVGALVASVPNAMGMDLAPAGYGAFGGQMIIGTESGVVALDLGSGTVTTIWAAGTQIPDVAFTPDGKLLAVRPSTGEVLDVAPDGSTTVFASGLNSSDGITVNPGTGEVFLADPNSNSLLKVSSDGGTVTAFATDAAVDGGYFPSPITFSVDGASLFYGTRESGTTVYRIDGFDAVAGNLNIRVTKTFSDLSTDDVEVTLTCNGGIPLEQSFTIAGGDPDGVTFTVTNLPEAGADCEVTETGGPDNYMAVLNGGSGCSWTAVTGGSYTCAIENIAEPAEYTVLVDWILSDSGFEEENYEVDVTISCDAEILTVDGIAHDGSSTVVVTLDDGESTTVEVDTAAGAAMCSATQVVTQSGVESEAAAECTSADLMAGDDVTCTFTNTVFFEGIPVLGNYGKALLVLLVLGVGLVGMRRFS